MKKKIYCKNCEWFRDVYDEGYACYGLSTLNPLFCNITINHKGNKVRKGRNKVLHETLVSRYKVDFNTFGGDYSCKLNYNFECPLYKRKWWKFWVYPKKGPVHILVELLKEREKK